ncbi:WD40 repeat domain-containing protein [Pseudonocardia sp. HH130630-07]|uniref:WD40 repeat domain-containing protein n=1 Tax=Pseudonocardia sp. HH130630-07 TaxID=1690815 RepID=UPI000815237D|nr:WD40 repeat domain-containing protein [Pseudonocardia sp. HH130630-07]ANY08486.1 hypothetical protein AFB00_21915 [Pseudonocardia sp. HH130630-07]
MPVETFWDGLEHRVVAGDALHGAAVDLAPPAGVSPATVHRLLALEAHHLGRPELAGQTGAVAQQLLSRAAVTGESALAGAARARIAAVAAPALATRWRTRPPAPALRRVLDGHGDAVAGLAVDPDGPLLSVDAAGGVCARDAVTALPVAHPVTGPCGPVTAAGPDPVLAVAVAPDGGLVALAGPGGIVRVLAASGARVATLRGYPGEVTVLAFAEGPTGATRLLGTGADGAIRVWDVARGTTVHLTGHTGPVLTIAGTAAGRVVTGAADGTLRAWDTATGEALATLRTDAAVTGVAVTGPGELVAVTADGAVHAFTLAAGVPRDAVLLDSSPTAPATAVVAAGTGRALVTRADGAVELWRTDVPGGRTVLGGHGVAARAAAASTDGSLVATGDDHGRVLLWDPAATGIAGDEPVPAGAVDSVAVAAGLVVSAARDGGELVTRDLRTGEERWRSAGGPGGATHLWSDAGGTRVFAAAGGTVTEWHAVTGMPVGSAAPAGRVLTGRGTLVVLGDGDRVRVADARTARVLSTVTPPAPARHAALTPGGATVLLGSDDTLTAWRPAGGAPVTVPLPGARLTGIAIDDDGCHAVATDADGTAHVWDLGDTRPVAVRADPVQVSAVAAVTGHRAVTTGTGGDAVLWDLTSATVLGRAPLDAPLTALATAHGCVVAGDGWGDTHCLDLLDGAGEPVVVPVPRAGAPAQGPGTETVPEQPAGALRRLLGLG